MSSIIVVMQNNLRKFFSGLVVAVALIAVVGAVFFRQELYDQWRLRGYEPSAEVVALAESTTMTDEAKRIFYVAHPSVTDADTFNANCHIEEFSIILGCYISRGNIYVYDVQDKRLSGIHEVTAAHEMLHAAYDRLDADERSKLDNLLVETYKAINSNRLNETIAQYQSNDPASVPNELHSILGTEVRKLPAALEEHYKKYFSDRLAVVSYSEKYEKVFSSRETRVNQIDRQLEALKADIELNQARLDNLNNELTSERQELNKLRSSNDFSEYNSKVDDYNQKVNEYNELVETTKKQINRYNDFVEERNSLAVEVQDLVKAIDSTPEAIE